MRKFNTCKRIIFLCLISFCSTSFLGAFTIYSGDGGPIIASAAQNCFDVEVTDDFILDSANGLESVCVDIDHPDINSFGILVSNPRNIASFVYQTMAFGNQMLNTCFSDNSTTPISADVSPYTGEYTPFSELNIVNDGGSSLGIWQVCVFFATPEPVDGILQSFDLNFNFDQPMMECSAPTNIIVDNISGTLARLSWDAASNVESYDLRYRTLGGDWLRRTVAAGEISLFINGLTPNTTYEYEVKAFCATEDSAWSATASFSTTEEICGITENLTAVVNEDLLATISWDEQPDASRYRLRYKRDGVGGSWTTVLLTENSIITEALLSDASYKVKVKSRCSYGWTVWSTTMIFETPPAVQQNRAVVQNDKIAIYPNPASHFINLDLNSAQLTRLTIYSAQGIKVAEYQDILPNRIELYNWQNGLYYLRAERKDNSFQTQSFYIIQ